MKEEEDMGMHEGTTNLAKEVLARRKLEKAVAQSYQNALQHTDGGASGLNLATT
jgi:hypothetical protein